MEKSDFVKILAAKLDEQKDSIQTQWDSPEGTRTKHFFVDDLLPLELAHQIFNAFPRDGNGFFNRDSFREQKRTSANLDAYDPILSAITYAFQDKEIVEKVASFLGLKAIEPDPKLYAGGLSMMFEGDFLNPHIDNSHDGSRERYRRLNLLYYVSPDWALERGANFELWDDKRTTALTIVSRFNRLIVMETTKESWHSVSPSTFAEPRCCVSNYYFSQISPDDSEYFHVTSFTGRPEEKAKQVLGLVDNGLRNIISKTFKVGRGKHLINDKKD